MAQAPSTAAGATSSSAPSPTPQASRGSASGDAALGLYQRGYILEKTLGNGAYAKVKQAHDIAHSRKVAIKIIDKKKAPREVLTKFLPREMEALQKMSYHDNVIDLYELIETSDKVCFVMELADNGDLLDYINSKKRLSERTARNFFKDLISGISANHRKHIVHRDIKCENLLLDANYRLKLSDFGFARKVEEGHCLETFCGSFAYAPPEIILGEPYNGLKSDIWSMGVVLYAMVCGKLPFKDNDIKTLLSLVSSGLVFASEVSESCRDLIRKIFVYSPRERASISDILAHPWMRQDPEELR